VCCETEECKQHLQLFLQFVVAKGIGLIREDLGHELLLRLGEGSRIIDNKLAEEGTILRRRVVHRHTFVIYLHDEFRPCHTLTLDLNGMAVKMLNGTLEPEQRLLDGKMNGHPQILTLALESRMRFCLDREDDIARDDTRSLLGHHRILDRMSVVHALLDGGLDGGVLVLAFVVGWHINLLLHKHARSHLLHDRLRFGRAARAFSATVRVLVPSLVAAHTDNAALK